MKKQNGYMGVVAILVVVLFIAFFMMWLWNKNWFGGKLDIGGGIDGEGPEVQEEGPVGVDQQLNDLRQDVKTLQNQRDQEIMDAINETE